jgi:hypothetical protein
VIHLLTALDLATSNLFYQIRDHKRSREYLDSLKVQE